MKSTLTATNERKAVWIAVAGVCPGEGCELIDPDKGAYVNFLTLASAEVEYRSKLTDALNYYHLELLELGDIRPFSIADNPDNEIIEIARELEEQQNPKHVRYATFYTFPRTM